jgi:hypothetical protein
VEYVSVWAGTAFKQLREGFFLVVYERILESSAHYVGSNERFSDDRFDAIVFYRVVHQESSKLKKEIGNKHTSAKEK